MLHIIKRRSVILSSIFSFIIGCTFTVSLLNLDNCNNLINGHNRTLLSNKYTKSNDILLIILILTSPVNVNRRNIIRDTWLSLFNNDTVVKHYFVIGSDNLFEDTRLRIEEEQSRYHDLMLLPNVVDNYSSLTRKILEAFLWLHNRRDNFQYMLKCDDDSFVQVDKVVSELKTRKLKSEGSLYWGFFNGRAQVKVSGKWKESDWILCDYYLPYALGGGYVLAQRLVHFIASNAEFLRLYKSEDVSVGVWLSAVNDVHRKHDPRFDTEFVSRGCSNSYLVTHKHNEEDMKKMFFSLQKTGKLCDIEHKLRKSYNYNWNVLPSKCCIRNDSSIP
ncbi:beta-1,3-galactosyltransferase 6-like [Periplaneta americana]|uniref:beta-1,3-galactosyltransferase 6-like n=1 Tax=Periplaneta americana TaxID=6978 RepID=UPI0037E9B4CC